MQRWRPRLVRPLWTQLCMSFIGNMMYCFLNSGLVCVCESLNVSRKPLRSGLYIMEWYFMASYCFYLLSNSFFKNSPTSFVGFRSTSWRHFRPRWCSVCSWHRKKYSLEIQTTSGVITIQKEWEKEFYFQIISGWHFSYKINSRLFLYSDWKRLMLNVCFINIFSSKVYFENLYKHSP